MAFDVLWRVHAALMTASFLSLITGIIISLLFKKKIWRFKLHKKLGIIAAILEVSAFVTAFIMIQISGGFHLRSLHSIIGIITVALIIITPIAGNNIMKASHKKEFKILHRILGFLTLIMMTLVIILGLGYAGLIYLPF